MTDISSSSSERGSFGKYAMIVAALAFVAVFSIFAINAADDSDARVSPDFTVGNIGYMIISDNQVSVLRPDDSGTAVNVEIPSSVMNGGTTYTVMQISSNAFYNCDYLKTIIIPSGISIESQAFAQAVGLEEVTIKSNCTVKAEAFYKCDGLKKVTIESDVTVEENGFFDPIAFFDTDGETPVAFNNLAGYTYSGEYTHLVREKTDNGGLTTVQIALFAVGGTLVVALGGSAAYFLLVKRK